MTRPDERQNAGKNQSKEQVKKDAQNLKQEAQQKAQGVSQNVKQEAESRFNEGRNKASSEMHTMAHAARAAADDLQDQNHEGLSSYVSEIAQNMDSLADNLRGKSADELVHEVTRMAKRNPALFITGSLAIGFGLSRFAKSSSTHEHSTQGISQGMGASSGGTQQRMSDNLYPGFDDSEPASRGGITEGRGYGEQETWADYTSDQSLSADNPSSTKPSTANSQLPTGKSTGENKGDTTGRKPL
jgi:uncharacterized protein (DUF3084 family)